MRSWQDNVMRKVVFLHVRANLKNQARSKRRLRKNLEKIRLDTKYPMENFTDPRDRELLEDLNKFCNDGVLWIEEVIDYLGELSRG